MNIGQILANKGRLGDTMVAHISPQEAAILKAFGGAGTKNPKTGLPEFWSIEDLLFGGSPEGMGGDANAPYNPQPVSTPEQQETEPAQQETAPQAVAQVEQAISQAPAQAVEPQYTQPNNDPSDLTRGMTEFRVGTPPPVQANSSGWFSDNSYYNIGYDSPEGGGLGGGESYASTRPPEEQVYANGVPVIPSDAYDAKYAGYKTPQQIIDEANQKATEEYDKTRPLDFLAMGHSPEGMNNYSDPTNEHTGQYLTQDKYGNYIFYTDQYKAQNPNDEITGANVQKVYEDPTKYYHDFSTDLTDKYGLYTTSDGSMYFGDETGTTKYGLNWDKDNKTATVDIDGKTYNVRRGDETKFSYHMPTTEDMQKADYSGKYDATVAADPEWQKGKWDDFGNGWKTKTFYGQTYYAMPGDDVTKAGYTGLTEDQVKNWYTTDGTNYSGGTAWGKDPVSGDYFRPLTTLSTSTGTPEEGSAPVFETGMNRKLRPGEENSGMGVIGDLMGHLEWVVPAILSMGMGMEIGQGLTSSIGQGGGSMGGAAYYPASGAHSMGGGLLGGSIGGVSASGAALPATELTLSGAGSAIGDAIGSIPSALSNLSWGSLAPSSLKSVLLPAAIGGGVRGLQTDWDLMEMLKGAGIGAVSGYGLDRLSALWNYATSPNPVPGSSLSDYYGNDRQLGDWAQDFTSTHRAEILGNLGYGNNGVGYDVTLSGDVTGLKGSSLFDYLDPNKQLGDWAQNFTGTHPAEFKGNLGLDQFGNPITDGTGYDVTLVDKRPFMTGPDGHVTYDNWDFPDLTQDWIDNHTPYKLGPDGRLYMDNFDFPGYSTEDPFGTEWRINYDQYNGGPVGLAKPVEINWDQYNGGPVGYPGDGSGIWDLLSSIPGLASKLLPLVPLLTGGVTAPPGGGGFPGGEFPVGGGEASSSGGASFTGSEGVNASGTGGAGRESAQARASRIAAIQALQDEINKKFSGQLYYS